MTGTIFDDIFDDAEALESVDTKTTATLSSHVRHLRGVEDDIAEAEQRLKDLKAEKHRLSVDLIPSLMDEMGVDRIDVDGLTVSVKLLVNASIKAENKKAAFEWLRTEGLDDIIKNDVTLSFGKGEDNVAGDIVAWLREKGFDPVTKEFIHPMTLKAFVRERVQDGKPIDLEMFGAFLSNVAEIKRK